MTSPMAPRRGPWRRLLVRVGVGVVVLCVAAAAFGRFGPGLQVRVQPSTRAASFAMELHSAHGASFVPALEGKGPLFILALGSDARPGQGMEHERSDSIHLIGVNAKTHQASILGFPRDSWVNIPGHGTGKITTAMVLGGPELVVQTIESVTGIQIDFWLLTSFWGLRNMVNAIGGLTIDVPTDMSDSYSNAYFTAGEHHMNGKQALSFARDRHDVPGGDLGRSKNQGILMLAALAKLHRVFEKNPAKIFTWVAVGWRQFHTDLDVATLVQLALAATTIPTENVSNVVVPATTGSVGEASVVFISSSASSVYADMKADGVIG
jgi:polyisoprenyl-teichoic acid--peptidoglycan teichoic acid transferase